MNTINITHFEEMESADLMINIWSCNGNKEHLKYCDVCEKYERLSIEVLKKRWEEQWGNFEYVISKLKENDKEFVDLSKYSSETMHEIIDVWKKLNIKK